MEPDPETDPAGTEHHLREGGDARSFRPVWESKTLRIGGFMAAVGAAVWFWRHRGTEGENADLSSSALFRLGAGYAGGYLIGWAFKRFLKFSFMATIVLIVLFVAAKGAGIKLVDWSALYENTREGVSWMRGEARELKAILTGYLPSWGAGIVGFIMGLRHK